MKIEKSEATVTQSCTAEITIADIRKAFKIPEDAAIDFVSGNQILHLEGDEIFAVEWTEVKAKVARKPRAKKAVE